MPVIPCTHMRICSHKIPLWEPYILEISTIAGKISFTVKTADLVLTSMHVSFRSSSDGDLILSSLMSVLCSPKLAYRWIAEDGV